MHQDETAMEHSDTDVLNACQGGGQVHKRRKQGCELDTQQVHTRREHKKQPRGIDLRQRSCHGELKRELARELEREVEWGVEKGS